MKKILAVLITFAAFCFPVGAAAAADNGAPESMLVLGDSISTGYGLYAYSAGNNYNTASYANLLAEKLGLNQQSDYKNLAVDGQTSGELIKKLNDGEYDDELSAELIVITIGGNDLLGEFLTFLQESVGLDLIDVSGGTVDADFTNPELLAKLNELLTTIDENIAVFSNNSSELLRVIHEKNPDAYLVFQMVYDPLTCLPIPETVINMLDNKIKLLNNTLEHCIELENADGEYAAVADIYSAFQGSADELTNMLDGDIHPSAAGHEVISDKLYEIVSAHEFVRTEKEASTETTEAAQAAAALEDVSRSELSSVALLSVFAMVFGICVMACAVILIKRSRRKK